MTRIRIRFDRYLRVAGWHGNMTNGRKQQVLGFIYANQHRPTQNMSARDRAMQSIKL